MRKAVNILNNSLKRRNLPVMAGKVLLRLTERSGGSGEWCRAQAGSCEEFLKGIDPDLWRETQAVTRDLAAQGQQRLAGIGLDMGGGGNYELLYFLCRHKRPSAVVETGVAAGWSSAAILTALEKNGQGTLYSSDFPYFRYENPESLIGCVVPEELKNRWRLFIDGDRNNLPQIVASVPRIDIFHYDSDKSIAGRRFAIETVQAMLADDAAVVFDDIQDNNHFRDYVEKAGKPFRVFEFGGKYVGLTGPFVET
ncbi:MAG: class I SAM-dependent methyltransferase [Alphaproteobacteria bacterium]|nr:class I SAM-dependent methyltransferase [Alphaproteobacteria bacterium]